MIEQKPDGSEITEEWSAGDKALAVAFIAFLIFLIILYLFVSKKDHIPTTDGHDYGRLILWLLH